MADAHILLARFCLFIAVRATLVDKEVSKKGIPSKGNSVMVVVRYTIIYLFPNQLMLLASTFKPYSSLSVGHNFRLPFIVLTKIQIRIEDKE